MTIEQLTTRCPSPAVSAHPGATWTRRTTAVLTAALAVAALTACSGSSPGGTAAGRSAAGTTPATGTLTLSGSPTGPASAIGSVPASVSASATVSAPVSAPARNPAPVAAGRTAAAPAPRSTGTPAPVRPATTAVSGRDACPSSALVKATLGQQVGVPGAQVDAVGVLVCAYPAAGNAQAVVVRIQNRQSTAGFAAGRRAVTATGQRTSDVGGLFDAAYVGERGTGGAATRTLAVLNDSTEVAVTARTTVADATKLVSTILD